MSNHGRKILINAVLTCILLVFFLPGAVPATDLDDMNIGLKAMERGKYVDAIEHFRRILENRPQWLVGYRLLAACYAVMGDWSTARLYLTRHDYWKLMLYGPETQPDVVAEPEVVPVIGSQAREIVLKLRTREEEQVHVYATIDVGGKDTYLPDFLLKGKTLFLHERNSEESPVRGELIHGEVVEVKKTQGNFTLIRKSNGTEGWILKSHVLIAAEKK